MRAIASAGNRSRVFNLSLGWKPCFLKKVSVSFVDMGPETSESGMVGGAWKVYCVDADIEEGGRSEGGAASELGGTWVATVVSRLCPMSLASKVTGVNGETPLSRSRGV